MYYIDKSIYSGEIADRRQILQSLWNEVDNGVHPNRVETWKSIQDSFPKNVNGGEPLWRRMLGATGEQETLLKQVPASAVRSSASVWSQRAVNGGSKAFAVYGIYQSGSNIFNADDKVRATVSEAGSWAGGLAGAKLGAFGFAAGPVVGTITTIGGGVIGSVLGKEVVDGLYPLARNPELIREVVKPNPNSMAGMVNSPSFRRDMFGIGSSRGETELRQMDPSRYTKLQERAAKVPGAYIDYDFVSDGGIRGRVVNPKQ